MSLLDQTKAKMKAAIEHLKEEMKNLRTGKANPGLLESIHVEVYGSEAPLKSIASISVQDNRQLIVTPFDPQHIGSIKKAIEKSSIGLTPITEAKFLRIPVPPMTQEIRTKMIKFCHELAEQTKISIRNIRRDANETIRKQKAKGEIAEDLMRKMEEDNQKYTNEFCKEADEIAQKKEKEISTI